MSISKRTRFEVFKRDGFTCQYCGKTPPGVILECDHVNPRANGGLDAIDNLLTACLDCNHGKSDRLLTAAPPTISDKIALLAEKRAQMRAFDRLLRAQKAREDKQVSAIEEIFRTAFPSQEFTPAFRSSIKKNFLPYVSASDVEYAMHLACSRRGDHPGGATSYFCGVCWRMRREVSRG